MDFFSGAKAYIVAALMMIVGVARTIGLDLPITGWEDIGSIDLIMQGFAVFALRIGIKKSGPTA